MGIATGKDNELVDFTKNKLLAKFKIKPSKFYYRPFDVRYTIFDNKILQRARYKLMLNYLDKNYQFNDIIRDPEGKNFSSVAKCNIGEVYPIKNNDG